VAYTSRYLELRECPPHGGEYASVLSLKYFTPGAIGMCWCCPI